MTPTPKVGLRPGRARLAEGRSTTGSQSGDILSLKEKENE